MKRPRVLVAEFHQESNSFNPIVWDEPRFRSMLVCRGPVMRLMHSLLSSPVRGMLRTVSKMGGRCVMGVGYRSGSGGKVADALVDKVVTEVTDTIKRRGPFDGVLLSLHGATVAVTDEDACGKLVSAVRQAAPNAVIACACDLHANVTKRMRSDADFLCGYQTYPHTDHEKTGARAAALLMRKLLGETLVSRYAEAPMIVPASGYTTADGAFYDVMRAGFDAVSDGSAVDFTVFQMQPWLDVKEAASVAAVTAEDADKAQRLADLMAGMLWDARHAFTPALTPVDEIIAYAETNRSGKPVILADASDSPNGGAAGDSVFVLEKLVKSGSALKALFPVTDPDASDRAFSLGVGAEGSFTLGGRYTPGLSSVTLRCTVVSLHRGVFRLAGPAGKGLRMDIGKTAVLRCGNTDILVCRTPAGTGDVNFYRAFGLPPKAYALVVVKANTSFRQAYAAFSDRIFIADTPGAGTARLTELPFTRLPRDGFYPFCEQ